MGAQEAKRMELLNRLVNAQYLLETKAIDSGDFQGFAEEIAQEYAAARLSPQPETAPESNCYCGPSGPCIYCYESPKRKVEDRVWMVVYEDSDTRPVVFKGEGAEQAAREFYNREAVTWSCKLMVEVRG